MGFSLWWLLLLWSMGSRGSGFSSCGSQALESRLNSCGAPAQLLCDMLDLPRPGLESVSPALAGRFLTTAPPGKPPIWVFILKLMSHRTPAYQNRHWYQSWSRVLLLKQPQCKTSKMGKQETLEFSTDTLSGRRGQERKNSSIPLLKKRFEFLAS